MPRTRRGIPHKSHVGLWLVSVSKTKRPRATQFDSCHVGGCSTCTRTRHVHTRVYYNVAHITRAHARKTNHTCAGDIRSRRVLATAYFTSEVHRTRAAQVRGLCPLRAVPCSFSSPRRQGTSRENRRRSCISHTRRAPTAAASLATPSCPNPPAPAPATRDAISPTRVCDPRCRSLCLHGTIARSVIVTWRGHFRVPLVLINMPRRFLYRVVNHSAPNAAAVQLSTVNHRAIVKLPVNLQFNAYHGSRVCKHKNQNYDYYTDTLCIT